MPVYFSSQEMPYLLQLLQQAMPGQQTTRRFVNSFNDELPSYYPIIPGITGVYTSPRATIGPGPVPPVIPYPSPSLPPRSPDITPGFISPRPLIDPNPVPPSIPYPPPEVGVPPPAGAPPIRNIEPPPERSPGFRGINPGGGVGYRTIPGTLIPYIPGITAG